MLRRTQIIGLLPILLLVVGCAASPDSYNTQRGAAVGAGIGAIMGQAIGHSTHSTLLGAGVGGMLGSVIGYAEDQKAVATRERSRVYAQIPPPPTAPAPRSTPPAPAMTPPAPQGPLSGPAPPPGRWITVPGQWINGRWIPPHQEWEPVNP